MLDLHIHVLAGLDDGPGTLAESLEIARASAADGVRVLAATPHVRDDYPTTADEMETALAGVRGAVAEAGLEIDVLPGGEIALDWLSMLDGDDLRRFGLAGNPGYALVEFPYAGWPLSVAADVDRLRRQGITAVLAHPERNPEVQTEPERLRPLTSAGALVQVTAASLDGRLGGRIAGAARELVNRGLAHMLASDAHTPAVRTGGLSAAAKALRDDALARWLTTDVPAAIVDDHELPPRPTRARRSMFFWRR